MDDNRDGPYGLRTEGTFESQNTTILKYRRRRCWVLGELPS